MFLTLLPLVKLILACSHKNCTVPETHFIAMPARKGRKNITSEKDLNQEPVITYYRFSSRAHTEYRETAKDKRANVTISLAGRYVVAVAKRAKLDVLRTSERFKYRYLPPIISREDFLLRRSRFQQLFAIHRKDNFAFGEGATSGIPATIHPRLRLSACLIFRIYRP